MLPGAAGPVVALVAVLALAAAGCPPGCSCGGVGLSELTCAGGRIYRVRDDGYAEADCQGLPLDCSLIPPLPTPAPLHRLELTNCSLPPGAAACLVRALRSPPPEVIMTMGLVEGVGEGAFDGLEGVQELIMMNAGSQTSFPPLAPLSPLRLRVVGATNLTLPPSPLPPSLRSLEVSDSGVRSLTPAAFRGLNDLDTLRVWGNQLEEIDDEVFESLPSLRTLSVSRNPLKRLSLSKAARLESLTALRVDVDILREGDVSGLLQLKEMTLESRGPLVLEARALGALPALRALAVCRSGVGALPPALLAASDALRNLSLAWNRIQTLDGRLFLNKSAMERLDLSHNQLAAVDGDTLRELGALQHLDLDYNMITALPERAFSSLRRLATLSLRHNLVAAVSPAAFPASPLRALRLAHNRLHYAPPPPPLPGDDTAYFDLGPQSPFNALLELEELDLSYNNISYMFSDWRYVLIQRLQLLDLSHNAFTELNSGDLQFLQAGLTVDLTYNHISAAAPSPAPSPSVTLLLDHNPFACDCNLYPLLSALPALPGYRLGGARCALPPPLRDRPLAALDVGALTCPLPGPAPAACLFRPHRERLECTGGEVGAPPDPRLYGLPSLYLRLTSDVDLSELPPYVTEVNMSRLGLEHVGRVPGTLQALDLRHNRLRRVPLQLLEGNLTLLLEGNPLACDCWDMDAVLHLQKYQAKVGDFELVNCESGGAVGVVDASALCDVHKAAAVGSILAVLGIMLAIVLALSWRYSVEIRLYLSTLPGLEFLLDEEVLDEGKLYDVFVSFSHEDFPWVRDALLPVLDREYRVCVHYRQWQVGQPIPVQIQRSVQQSRRTVVVLSGSFARSTWAVEEFRAACAASARDHTARAVVLLLEPVDAAALPRELRDYLSLTTYLEAGDPKFWEKLKRALPRRPMKRPGDPAPAPVLPADSKLPSLLTAFKNRFKKPSVIDLPDPVKVPSDPKPLDVVLDRNGQLVNRGYVKDV